MPSNFIKIFLAFTGLSPALLMIYILKLIAEWETLSIYFTTNSYKETITGIVELFRVHYLLLLFFVLVIISRLIIKFAERHFHIGRIDVKSIKPSDNNFNSVIFSIIPASIKFSSPSIADWKVLIIFCVLGYIIGVTMKASYHHNVVLKLLLNYNHYEIQTKDEVTYLMLSKRYLIDKREISEYVRLADHMLLDISNNNNNNG